MVLPPRETISVPWLSRVALETKTVSFPWRQTQASVLQPPGLCLSGSLRAQWLGPSCGVPPPHTVVPCSMGGQTGSGPPCFPGGNRSEGAVSPPLGTLRRHGDWDWVGTFRRRLRVCFLPGDESRSGWLRCSRLTWWPAACVRGSAPTLCDTLSK